MPIQALSNGTANLQLANHAWPAWLPWWDLRIDKGREYWTSLVLARLLTQSAYRLAFQLEGYSIDRWKSRWMKKWVNAWAQKSLINEVYSTQRQGTARIYTEPALFNVFVDDLGDIRVCTLFRSRDGNQLQSAINMLEGRAGIQSWLSNRLVLKINKEKFKVLHQIWTNHPQQYRWG